MIDKLKQISPKVKLVVVLVIVAAIIAIFAALLGGRESIDRSESGGEFVEPYTNAFIVYDGSPYIIFTDDMAEKFLKDDLAFFARKVYPEAYGTDGLINVVFTLSNPHQTTDSNVLISGTFNEVNNQIEVRATILNNGRISLSITDVTSGTSIDNQLSSNSNENKFIGRLPIEGDGYSILYEPPDRVAITVLVRNKEAIVAANNKIIELVGEETFETLNKSLSFPTANFQEQQ